MDNSRSFPMVKAIRLLPSVMTPPRPNRTLPPSPARVTRRAALSSAVVFTTGLALGLHHARGAEAAAGVEQAHAEIWRRFIDPHDILIDYADADGKFPRPTPEECRAGKPNALGW